MTSVEIRIDKEIELLCSKLSKDLNQTITPKELIDIIIKIGSKDYDEILNVGKIILLDENLSEEQIKIAKSYIIDDVSTNDISENIDDTLYG